MTYCDRSRLKRLNLLNKSRIFNIDLKIEGHIVHQWKALRYSKDDSRGLSCGSTLNIHQNLLKSGNLLHKQGFVDSQFCTTVHYSRLTAAIALSNKFFVNFHNRWCISLAGHKATKLQFLKFHRNRSSKTSLLHCHYFIIGILGKIECWKCITPIYFTTNFEGLQLYYN